MPAEHTQSPIFTEHWYRGCVRCTCAVLPGVGQLWGHHTRAFAFQQLPGLRAGLETEAQPLCPGAFSKKLLIKNAGNHWVGKESAPSGRRLGTARNGRGEQENPSLSLSELPRAVRKM